MPTEKSAQSYRADVRTPVTLLTGFLGSGKTTLLNRALASPTMSRTAVIINEFGKVGIDHVLITISDDVITVLENGCLCCTVFGDLVGTLNRLYYAREANEILAFDHVVIETSGLADPTPILQAFLSEPTLAGLYRIGAIITTVDAVNGMATLDDHSESLRQVALASHILVTMMDLASTDPKRAVSGLFERLRHLNSAARLSLADDPNIDAVEILRHVEPDPACGGDEALAWLNAQAYRSTDTCNEVHDHDAHSLHQSSGHHTDDIAAFCLVRETPSSLEALQLLLSAIEQNLGRNLLRVKGLVNVTETPGRPAVLQGAQHLLHNLVHLEQWPSADHRTRIIFITQHMAVASLNEMVTTLERVANRTSAARACARATVDDE